ncbi:asparagine synthase-related protein [bacterium]|nr:asparagine synthase-related protein [bacterium]MDA7660290.1 asparagine synthase-related protein [Verrucomicrobiota bacterium]
MCGFLYYHNKNGLTTKLRHSLNIAFDSIIHRGPDHSAYHSTQKSFFGHHRLKILGNDYSNQPFKVNRDILLYNGEIYNYLKLDGQSCRDQKTFCDTEYLFNIIKTKQFNKFREFNGMFAFLFYDHQSDAIYFGRDFNGIKPLYKYIDDNVIILSSEMRPIQILQTTTYNQKSDEEFLLFGYNLLGSRIFQEIEDVSKGTIYKVNLQNLKTTVYSKIEPEPHDITTNYKTFNQTISEHFISNFKSSLMISSGYDSNIIDNVATKTENTTFNKIHCYNSNYENNEMDFLKNNHSKSEEIEYLDCNLKEINFSQVFSALGQPIMNTSHWMISEVCKHVKNNNIKVLLSGIGGDEYFCGYNRYRMFNLRKILPFSSFFQGSKSSNKIISVLFERECVFLQSLFNVGFYNCINKVYKKEYISFNRLKFFNNKIKSRIESFSNGIAIKNLMEFDQNTYLYQNLINFDRITMHHGVEGRSPLVNINMYRIFKTLTKKHVSCIYSSKPYLRDYVRRHAIKFNKKKMGFSGNQFDLIVKSSAYESIMDNRRMLNEIDFNKFEKIYGSQRLDQLQANNLLLIKYLLEWRIYLKKTLPQK